MKKAILICLLGILTLGACQNDVTFPYQGKDAVYFQVNSTWSVTTDSIEYSFAGKGKEEDVVEVRVNLQGNMAATDRKVRVVIDSSKSTAEEGIHYQPLAEDYILPANAVSVNVPVTVLKKDADLENKKVILALQLEPTADFELGITERTEIFINISNMLKKPTYWDSTIKYNFGVYSRKKHELCMQVLGIGFPETSSEYYSQNTMWGVYGKYMSNYFEENYPVYDENGGVIEPW